jgi:hypothetical protein
MSQTTLGGLILALPALVAAWGVLWRRERGLFWFAAALILVGVGYLMVTGAAADIANVLLGHVSAKAGR